MVQSTWKCPVIWTPVRLGYTLGTMVWEPVTSQLVSPVVDTDYEMFATAPNGLYIRAANGYRSGI